MLRRTPIWGTYFFLMALPAFGAVEFNRDIRPILSDKCFTCHGPDSNNRFTKLRFDTEAGAKQDLGGGRHAIVSGDTARSQMIVRITATDTAKRMPPLTSGHKLTESEIAMLRKWIEEGARWQQHWHGSRRNAQAFPRFTTLAGLRMRSTRSSYTRWSAKACVLRPKPNVSV